MVEAGTEFGAELFGLLLPMCSSDISDPLVLTRGLYF